MESFFYALCRLALSLWAGGAGIFTFLLTPILFKSLDRDEAGRMVGLLFPGYFRWGMACGAVSLIALLAYRGKHFIPALALVVVMLCLTSFQAFYVEPKAAQIKKDIPSFVTTPKDHPARVAFSRLHAVSAVCNLVVFAGGAVLVVLL